MNTKFAQDVKQGLESSPKTLPSKYFYNKRGSELFSAIMQLPEYYLTNAEMEIFSEQSSALIKLFNLNTSVPFDLLELGAGDGKKTIKLLKALSKQNYTFTYHPIDISAKALQQVEGNIAKEIPNLSLQSQKGDYFEILNELKNTQKPKVVLFLGSNLGNMNDQKAEYFLSQLSENLNPGDKLVLGLDLQKSPDIILPAYNDREGVTSEFNLNLLHRINTELGANFDLSKFKHAPEYDEVNGIAKSYIQSKVDQAVTIKTIETTIEFAEGEKIHTEISRKYNHDIVFKLCDSAGFEIVETLSDSKGYFADFVLIKR